MNNIPLINEEINANEEIDPAKLSDLFDDQQADKRCAEQEYSQENQDNHSVDYCEINDQNDLEGKNCLSE